MAKNSIRDYSNVNSSNSDIQSIDISEGCSPAGINNAIREVMADLKDVSTGAVALESPAADSLSVTGDLTVDTNTLYVDSTNNRVGIGTTSPSAKAHIQTASSGSSVASSGDELFVEGSGDAGITVGAGNTSKASLFFADNGDSAAGRIRYDHSDNSMQFGTNGQAERMRIDSSGNVIVKAGKELRVNRPDDATYGAISHGASGTGIVYNDVNGDGHHWQFNGSEKMRIDSSGNLLVGRTSVGLTGTGHSIRGADSAVFVRAGGEAIIAARNTDDGQIIRFDKDGSPVGSIGTYGNTTFIQSGASASYAGLLFNSNAVEPTRADGGSGSNPRVDNLLDLGSLSYRFDDVYATNGTIQTSDANEKQQIAALTDAEITAAKAISQLFKTFKWNDAVAEKGDAARTHAGVIAQDVQAAMTAAGLDAGDYAFFISSTWWETQTEVPAVEAVEAVYEDVIIPAVLDEDGNEVEAERTEQRTVTEAVEAQEAYTRTDTYETAEEAPEGATERTRLGIRYPELLAFVGAATEQRLANIETRLAALEAN